MDSNPPPPSPAASLTPPLQLHEKELLFADWGLSDTDGSQSPPSSGTAEKTNSRLAEREREHRRKSRAFAAAAKRAAGQAAEKARAEEVAKRMANQEDEDSSDSDSIVEVIDLTRPAPPPPPRPPRRTASTIIESVRASATLRRTSSNPLPEGRKPKRKREEETAKRQPGRPPKAARKDNKDKKDKKGKADARDITPPLVPERQRIFDGLSFYYLPDGAFGARKLRINKARQHGARWVHSLSEATHVVVDKQLRWGEVEVYVKEEMATTPASTETSPKWPILVNETYPLDCIGFRHLLNPEQLRYRITGWTQAQAAKEKEKEKAGEKEKKMRKVETKANNTSSSSHYPIKPDRRQQNRLGTVGHQEHMVRQPRQGG
jgi:DNA polymerase IV